MRSHRISLFFIAVVLIAVGCLFALPTPASATDFHTTSARSVTVVSRDGEITIMRNGDVRVVETWKVRFSGSPPFTYAYREIPLNKVEDITNWAVAEGGTPYRHSESGAPGTFSVQRRGSGRHKAIRITWHFAPTLNQTRTFTLAYTLKGAVWIGKETDHFFWKFIESDRQYLIERSSVVVHLPARFSPDKVFATAYRNGREERGAAKVAADGETVSFNGRGFPGGTEWEIAVRWPHGAVQAAPPAWEQEEKMRPWIDLGGLLLALFIALGSIAGGILLWYLRGRDPAVGAVPEFLTSPPDDVSPGILGTVVDEKADLQDVLATMLDLARRGYLQIVAENKRSLFGHRQEVRFVCLKPMSEWEDLLIHERAFMLALFDTCQTPGKVIYLDELRDKFYASLPIIQSALYDEVTEAGYFAKAPSKVRSFYTVLAVIAGFIAAIPAVVAYMAGLDGFVVTALAFAAGVAAIAFLVIAQIMPRKTKKGAVLAAKARAFRNYLKNLERYTSVEQAKSQFEKYLPYATAFGLSQTWIRRFAAANVPAPRWYYVGSPGSWDSARGTNTTAMGGKMAAPPPLSSGGSLPSLNNMADGTFASLSDLSDSLTNMLNEAASTFTSRPSNSDGGGFSGGGGGGGGSSGFG